MEVRNREQGRLSEQPYRSPKQENYLDSIIAILKQLQTPNNASMVSKLWGLIQSITQIQIQQMTDVSRQAQKFGSLYLLVRECQKLLKELGSEFSEVLEEIPDGRIQSLYNKVLHVSFKIRHSQPTSTHIQSTRMKQHLLDEFRDQQRMTKQLLQENQILRAELQLSNDKHGIMKVSSGALWDIRGKSKVANNTNIVGINRQLKQNGRMNLKNQQGKTQSSTRKETHGILEDTAHKLKISLSEADSLRNKNVKLQQQLVLLQQYNDLNRLGSKTLSQQGRNTLKEQEQNNQQRIQANQRNEKLECKIVELESQVNQLIDIQDACQAELSRTQKELQKRQKTLNIYVDTTQRLRRRLDTTKDVLDPIDSRMPLARVDSMSNKGKNINRQELGSKLNGKRPQVEVQLQEEQLLRMLLCQALSVQSLLQAD